MTRETSGIGLHEWQTDLISKLDPPSGSGHQELTEGRNVGEPDITYRRLNGQTWIYKCWKSRRVPDRYGLYAPSTGETHPISRRQYSLLTNGDWVASDDDDLVELANLVRPFTEEGWEIPGAPRLSNSGLTKTSRARVLMINPTEQCNIRCTYCYYGGAYEGTRPHQNRAPTIDDISKAIDIFLTDDPSMAEAQRAVYFFGGEPLLNFPVIREAYQLLERRVSKVGATRGNIVVQINTNGMLLSPEIVEFCERNDIYINVSIDGPNHDIYRIDRRGAGTRQKVVDRIDWMHSTYPEYFARRVALICVLTAPVDPPMLYEFFSTWPAALEALAWDFDLVLPGGNESYTAFEALFEAQLLAWDLFTEAHAAPVARRDRSVRYRFAFSHGFLHRSFHRAVNSPMRTHGSRLQNVLGVQALPGYEFLVLGADAKLYSSYEFQSEDFLVGDIDRGVDVASCVDQFAMFRDGVAAGSCATCWAAPTCTVTIPEIAVRETDSADALQGKLAGKRARCLSERENLVQGLAAKDDIATLSGDVALSSHREDWTVQAEGVSRIDYFKP